MSEKAAPKLPIDSIFHATDFSRASELAFVHALKIGLLAQAELTILHADDEGAASWRDYPGVRSTLERWGVLPEGSSPEAVVDLGLEVEKIGSRGLAPLKAILGYLKDFPSELVVLATEGREGLPRWLHRSVAELVARRNRSLTLFVPHGARPFVSRDTGESLLKRVLVPIDHSPRPRVAVAIAGAFARALGGEVEVLHVGDEHRMPAVDPPSDVPVQLRAVEGDVVDAILGAAEDSCELIVMATEGAEGFLDALRGTTTEQIVREAPCSVLAVPDRG